MVLWMVNNDICCDMLHQAGTFGMKAVTKILVLTDVFEEDWENKRTFYGFFDSDSEIDVNDY